MSEAPKKVWVSHMTHTAYEHPIDRASTTSYIRADLVDGLVEALKSISETVVYADEGGHDEVAECVNIARSALKALEEE